MIFNRRLLAALSAALVFAGQASAATPLPLSSSWTRIAPASTCVTVFTDDSTGAVQITTANAPPAATDRGRPLQYFAPVTGYLSADLYAKGPSSATIAVDTGFCGGGGGGSGGSGGGSFNGAITSPVGPGTPAAQSLAMVFGSGVQLPGFVVPPVVYLNGNAANSQTNPLYASITNFPAGGAKEAGGNLDTLVARTPALGQAPKAAASPVVLPSDPDTLLATNSITAVDTASTSTAGQNGVPVLTGTPTAGSAVSQAVNGQSMALISVRGTWSGSLVVEVSGDAGQTWASATALQRGTGIPAPTITGNGQFQADIAAQTNVRVRDTALASGSPAVQINLAQGPGLVRTANPSRIIDGVTGNQATIKPGAQAGTTDNALVAADPTVAAAIASSSVPTGSKGAPASTGVSLLTVGLPWVSSTTLEACKRFKVGSGTLFRIKVTLGTGTGSQPTGFLKLYDAASIPADGADTPQVVDIVGSNGVVGSGDDEFGLTPMIFSTGLVACFSTTGGFTKTSQPTPATLFSAQVQ